jgi:hypothetical protein
VARPKLSRVVDPEVGRLRSRLGVAEREGRTAEAEQARKDLAEALFFARLRKLSGSAPRLTNAQVIEASRILYDALSEGSAR